MKNNGFDFLFRLCGEVASKCFKLTQVLNYDERSTGKHMALDDAQTYIFSLFNRYIYLLYQCIVSRLTYKIHTIYMEERTCYAI